GSHVGRVWSAAGVLLAQVSFVNESASGWQQQVLASPLALQAGSTYVVSVNANSYFVDTVSGLASSFTAGPVASVAGPGNGVYANAAGTFPSSSYSSTNYFI